MEPSFVAEAALRVLRDEETGRCWVVQPNRIEPFRDPGSPGAAMTRTRPRLSWGEEAPPGPHIWRTLGYRGVEQGEASR